MLFKFLPLLRMVISAEISIKHNLLTSFNVHGSERPAPATATYAQSQLIVMESQNKEMHLIEPSQ